MAIKTEMHGTGGGRWTTREDAKQLSRRARRQADRELAADDSENSAGCAHADIVITPDGWGAYCKACGEGVA